MLCYKFIATFLKWYENNTMMGLLVIFIFAAVMIFLIRLLCRTSCGNYSKKKQPASRPIKRHKGAKSWIMSCLGLNYMK